MKLTKIISSAGRALWESIRRPTQCNNNNNGQKKQDTSRKFKDEKNKLTKLKTERTPRSNNFLKPKVAGEGEKPLAINRVDIFKGKVIDQKIKHKQPCEDKFDYNNENKLRRISSTVIFKRKFSKYDDVGHKLEAKFKSTYKNCGQFDPSWTKYKAYVNKNQNKKNKSYLKYAIRSSHSRKGSKNKKRTTPCADLPGKGTYNHRIAYDDALQLHRKGIDVDVLYKVKNNKSDSIYVINGGFLHTKNTKRFNQSKTRKSESNNMNDISQNQIVDDNNMEKDEQKDSPEELALWSAELAKLRKDKEIRKIRMAKMASVHRKNAEREREEKLEKFLRNQKIKEADKEFRAEQLRKIARAKALKESRKLQEQVSRNEKEKLRVDKNRQNADLQEQTDHRTQMNRLKQLKLQQNLLARRNTIGNPLDTKHAKALGEHKVIVDPGVINDIARWALHNDGCARAMSWLKIVAGRIDSLDGRVSQFYKNKWMRIAIDRVVDVEMAKKRSNVFSAHDMSRKSTCKKNSKVSSSFVIKTKRTAVRCRHEPAACCAGVHKSRKFSSVCLGRGDKTYELIKTEGSYFRVISVENAFGLCCGAKKRTKCCC